jgi:uncharacterized caspase-like protein
MPHLRRLMPTIRPSGRVLTALVGSLLIWALSSEAALAAKRVALVIGNSAYRSVAPLANPSRDAKAMAEMLKKAGFDVVDAHLDVQHLEFKRALRRFEDASNGAEIAVIYYGGHGIEIGGTNYLIPVDAKLANDRDAEDEAVSLDRLVLSAQPAQQLRLIILDACRDNPFLKTMKRQRPTRSITRGLGKVEPTYTNTLIAYAAKAGSTADDGDGENSPFTLALLKHLAIPGLDIRLAFGRVRDEVLKRTANRQEPFVYGSLGGSNIALVPLPAAAPPPAHADATGVRGDYQLVERIGTKKAWEVFLATHKTGLYADLAREQLAKLEDGKPAQNKPGWVSKFTPTQGSPSPAAPSPPQPPAAAAQKPPGTAVAALKPQPSPASPAPTSAEARAWDRIKDSSDPKAYRDFIERYPNSTLALTARKQLAALIEAAERDKKPPEKPSQQERQKSEQVCRREEQQLSQFKSSNDRTGARAGLERLAKDLGCERLRPAVVAALEGLAASKEPPAEPKPAANSPELVRAAQRELDRVGCFEGSADGKPGPDTRDAIARYLSVRGRPAGGNDVTESLVDELRKEKSRVCPLQCAVGEVAKGERCVAEKTKPERDTRRDRRDRRDAQDSKRTKQGSRPRPRQEASSGGRGRAGGGSGMSGVGF